jgi:NAD(P)-dependent dehydrogenase (short-subunit alcohol dehydrogenase family)
VEKGRPPGRTVLVTGASSGFGKAIASLLSRNGFNVFGTSRNAPGEGAEGVRMLRLDVTSDQSVHDCVREVLAMAGRIDVLVNNAGTLTTGAIEEFSIDEAKSQFETNFFGVARMTKEVLPMMRGQKGGQIINISSVGGLLPSPFEGFYIASKHAVEGYTETLRLEVKGLGIKVSLVEPGFFKTGLFGAEVPTRAHIGEYDAERKNSSSVRDVEHRQKALDPAIVAEVVLRIANSRAPRIRYAVGREKSAIRLKALVPEGMYESATGRHWKLDQSPPAA